MWEHQNIKIKFAPQTGLKTFSFLNTSKIRYSVIEDLSGEEVAETFYEKMLQKTNETDFRVEKVIKEMVNYISSRKVI